jgi:hypothetical protein
MDRCNRRFVILIAPAKFPTGASNGPRAEADRRKVKIRVTWLFGFHFGVRSRFMLFRFVEVATSKSAATDVSPSAKSLST